MLFVAATALLLPLVGIYVAIADPHLVLLADDGVYKTELKWESSKTSYPRDQLHIMKHRFKNYGLRTGYVADIRIRNQDNLEQVAMKPQYIDRRPIRFLQTKELAFEIVLAAKKPGKQIYALTFYDNTGAEIDVLYVAYFAQP